jgi:hypothetical protein
MKTSLSAPGMLRTGSDGLGIGYDDDEKARAEAAQFDGEFVSHPFNRRSLLIVSVVTTDLLL